MKIINNNLWLCADCTLVAINGDTDFIDCYYTYARALERRQEIIEGLNALPRLVYDFLIDDEDKGIDECSNRECDCCKSLLEGRRYRFKQLGE